MLFGDATALSAGATDNTFDGQIQPGWDILGNANGGYTMAMFARAALMSSERRDVISVSAHFLAPGKVGQVTAVTDPIKAGKRFATTRVELSSTERTVLSGTVITGDLDDGDGPELITATAPDIAPPSECIRTVSNGDFPPPFMNRIEQRIDPETVLGTHPGPFIRGWTRLLNGEPLDTLALVMASDSMPPTVFNTNLAPSWVPTVQMTIHIRNRPTTEWLLLDSHTRFITGGMFEVDNTIFDEHGTVLAHSRQLQLLGLAH